MRKSKGDIETYLQKQFSTLSRVCSNHPECMCEKGGGKKEQPRVCAATTTKRGKRERNKENVIHFNEDVPGEAILAVNPRCAAAALASIRVYPFPIRCTK